MSYDMLTEMVDGDSEKAKSIWEVSKKVISYSHFRSAVDLGITVGINDLPFNDVMLYSWIKEAIDERKT